MLGSLLFGLTNTSIAYKIGSHLVDNLEESNIDNCVRDKVCPKPGSVLYIEMACSVADAAHSGIYVGEGDVVELSGEGTIQKVSVSEFLDVPLFVNTAISIYVSCKDGHAVGSQAVARRARSMVGRCRDYNLIFDNCHQFTSGCLTGDFENSDDFLWMLKDTAKKRLGADEWRVWNR